MTLSSVVALKAETASDDDKDHLAAALFYLGIPSTGSVNEDILKLSAEIDKYVPCLRSLGVQLIPVYQIGKTGHQPRVEK